VKDQLIEDQLLIKEAEKDPVIEVFLKDRYIGWRQVGGDDDVDEERCSVYCEMSADFVRLWVKRGEEEKITLHMLEKVRCNVCVFPYHFVDPNVVASLKIGKRIEETTLVIDSVTLMELGISITEVVRNMKNGLIIILSRLGY